MGEENSPDKMSVLGPVELFERFATLGVLNDTVVDAFNL